MTILYGVQGTGQGHISRARAMAAAFVGQDVDVTWLFSGRSPARLFDMEPFPGYESRHGLSFTHREGKVQILPTLRDNKPLRFLQDVRQLDLAPYDLVVTDFEPVTAWAAKRRGVPCIGIGHQYAFGPGTPSNGGSWLSRAIMRNFAPTDTALGLHWHPYAHNVLPPILDLPERSLFQLDHILVYLPFEDQDRVTEMLRRFPERRFIQYANGLEHAVMGNVTRCPGSVVNFKRDLAACRGVLCNSGFELISECLQWRKPVLTKPLSGQMEQLSNALALEQLGYAAVMPQLSELRLGQWLESSPAAPLVNYSDVAPVLTAWLAAGCPETPQQLGRKLWQRQTPQSSSRDGSPLLRGVAA